MHKSRKGRLHTGVHLPEGIIGNLQAMNSLTSWCTRKNPQYFLGIALAAQNVGAAETATVVVEVVFACSLMPHRKEGWFVS